MSAADQDGDFSKTRWSMVQRLASPQAGGARDVLAALAVRYWYPVYTYVRRCGHAPQIAQDITCAFFQHMEGTTGMGAMPGGLFRDWLLSRLNEFLAGDWRQLSEGGPPVDAPALDELEARNLSEQLRTGSPEQAYQRGFALEVLAHGFATLQAEAEQTGRVDMYAALAPFLARDPLPGEYDEMARGLGVRPLVLVLALKRLRQRFRELVNRELADTVGTAEELQKEQHTLLAFLHGDA